MEKQFNRKYSLAQALNSSLLASMLVFASIYLLDKGLSNSTIGIIVALSSVASIFIQGVFAKLTDTYKEVSLQNMLSIQLAIILIAVILLWLQPSYFLFIFAVILAYSFIQATVPFINALAFSFEEHDIHIKFGVGRAFGSLSYAVVTLILGYIIEWTQPNILPLFYIVMTLGFMALVRTFRLPDSKGHLGEMETKTAPIDKVTVNQNSIIPKEEVSFKEFLNKYRTLFLVIIGIGLAMLGQTMSVTFLIQVVEPIGGTSSTVGWATFIGSLVEVPILMKSDVLLEKRSAAFWLKISMFFFIGKALILLFASNIALIYIAQIMQAGSYGFAYPAAVQYINQAVQKEDLFKGQTMFTIGLTISSVFANLIGGVLIDTFGLVQMIASILVVSVMATFITYAALIKEPHESHVFVPSKEERI